MQERVPANDPPANNKFLVTRQVLDMEDFHLVKESTTKSLVWVMLSTAARELRGMGLVLTATGRMQLVKTESQSAETI